ncbi:NADH dehydrogenase [ubiquinone] 1 subunit C2 [Syngnathus acus]|uniref:NADH dehydrogenase [ubiquinone] 1 subunit C2 n=1 Tax=Syngnathus acus TaxID=161584 RepID=UPI001885BB5A|nr:NADH dehydrogenase [ubiquinone] 1 subunit C2 [Syngnathus acus]XP_061137206.1 NADH dehydrogenase [ubiquinone] 1 subunit C2-like [Syngnathus typhle]XP_061137230.1 NADH dehydrogenase [ubiquinone] 1 subunit C2-like [Syngnathus typhle]
MGFIPDEGKGLPPPGIVNRNSLWLAGVGWCTAMLQNGLNHRPPLKSGAHRQVLMATIGWFIGYHVTKYENYVHAKLDRDMREYMKLHPDDFAPKEKKTFAEIVEPFIPVR